MNHDLTVGNPKKVLWSFCVPLFASVIFQQLYNIADSWVAGKFIGEAALAAVGNSYEITLIFIAIASGCNIGCSVVTSRYFGAKDYSNMKTAVVTSMLTSATFCFLLMFLGIFGGSWLLDAIKTPAELLTDSALYLKIYVWGLPFVFFYNIATGIFSALGDSKTPFWFLAISSVSNIGVDIIFVKYLNMGVAGVAWATFLCQCISCLLSLLVVFLRLKKIPRMGKLVLYSASIQREFILIAAPSMLQQICVSIGNIVLQSVINGFGTGVMAGYSAAVKLNNLVMAGLVTLSNGVSNFTSQNIGAKQYHRIIQGFKAGILLVWVICIPLTAIYCIFSKSLLLFFLDAPSAEALRSGMLFLRIISPFYVVISCKFIGDSVLRGAGSMLQFVISTFTDLLLRVILAFLLSATALGFVGIWCAWPIGWITATSISLILFRLSKIYKTSHEALIARQE